MIIKTVEEFNKFISTRELLAYDIETTGLNPRKNEIIGFGISDNIKGIYIPHLIWNGEALEEVFTKSQCASMVRALHNKKLITFNGSFDLRFTINYFDVDLTPALHCDAMLAKHTCDENAFSYKLKDTAAEVYGSEAKEEQDELKEYLTRSGEEATDFYKAPIELLAKYCVKDCILTYKLAEHYGAIMEQKGLTDFFFVDEVMPMYKEVTIPMELRGVPLDLDLLYKSKNEIEQDLKQLEDKIQALIAPLLPEFNTWFLNKEYPVKRTGPFVQKLAELLNTPLPRSSTGRYSLTAKCINSLPDTDYFKRWYLGLESYLPPSLKVKVQHSMHEGYLFNLLSKHHLKKLFFERLNETPTSTTDLGNPQVDESFLESVKSKYEFVPLLIEYNKLTKIKGTYIDRIIEKQEDGVYYPSLFQHRTVSGRQSGDLQQLPRILEDDQDTPLVVNYTNRIRRFFKAKDGFTFVGADYESLEPHIFAHVSTDKKLQDIFNKGHDFYSTIAIDTEGLNEFSPDKKAQNYLGKLNKVKRQTAKAYALGIPYGMSGYKLQFELGIDVKQAEMLVENYLNAYPNLKNWMNETHKKVCKKGYIRTEAGRIRHFPRAVEIFNEYGDVIFNDLDLWKKFNEDKGAYARAKKDRREFKNYLNNACNVQIQGLAASIVSRAAIKISRELKAKNINGYIGLAIHDELVVLCEEKDVQQVCNIMQEVMENIWKLSVQLKAEPKVAKVYADTK